MAKFRVRQKCVEKLMNQKCCVYKLEHESVCCWLCISSFLKSSPSHICYMLRLTTSFTFKRFVRECNDTSSIEHCCWTMIGGMVMKSYQFDLQQTFLRNWNKYVESGECTLYVCLRRGSFFVSVIDGHVTVIVASFSFEFETRKKWSGWDVHCSSASSSRMTSALNFALHV